MFKVEKQLPEAAEDAHLAVDNPPASVSNLPRERRINQGDKLEIRDGSNWSYDKRIWRSRGVSHLKVDGNSLI
jgi:hypothetical protein